MPVAEEETPATVAPPAEGRRSLRRDFSVITVLQAGSLALTLLNQVLLARLLGPGAKGVIDFFVLVTYFGSEFGSLGFASGVVFLATRRNVDPGRVHGASLMVAAPLALVTGVAIYAYGHFFAAPAYRPAVLLAAVGIPVFIYMRYWAALTAAVERAPLGYWANFGIGVLILAGIGALWAAGRLGAGPVVAANLAANLAVAVAGGAYLARLWPVRWSLPAAREGLRYSAEIYPGHFANAFHFRLDQYIVGVALGPAALGVYALAVRLTEVFWQLDGVMISATLSRLARGEQGESWALVKKMSAAVLAVGALAVVVAALLGRPVVTALFGPAFAGAAALLVPLLLGAIAWSCARVMAQFLGYRLERPRLCTIGAAVSAALNAAALLALYLFWPGRLSIVVVACVSMLSYTALAVITLGYILLILRNGERRHG